ncbi:MAG TPA: hypothetical protein VFD56_01670, partial [Chitinophagaceae bacterium]|nr:hypothetical protein [Chitinophagaceae bacterium]
SIPFLMRHHDELQIIGSVWVGQGQKKARNPEESQANNHMRKRESCRGRGRTSTRRLAAAQRFSGQSWSA